MSHLITDFYDVYDERFPQAHKERKCNACHEHISSGQHYARVGIVFEGSARTIVRCLRCQKIHEHLRTLDGDIWPEECLDCGEQYEDEWGELPDDIAALAFALPGELDRS